MLKASYLLSLLMFGLVVSGCTDECADAEPCTGTFDIENESELEALELCEYIDGSLYIEGHDWLTDINLPCLTAVVTLVVRDNDSLANLNGLSSLSLVDSTLWVLENGSLTDLDGLSDLTSVGTLSIGRNKALTNLDGLSNLTGNIMGLSIHHNDSLTSLDGLSNVTSVGLALTIMGNDCLSQAEAEAFAAQLGLEDYALVTSNGSSYPCD